MNTTEANYLKVDASKARARLQWSQALRLEQALEWTVNWYKKFLRGESALTLTEEQIDRFGRLGQSA